MQNKIFALIFLVSISLNAQIYLQEHTVIDDTKTTLKPYAVSTADFNGDNKLDVIVASEYEVCWYEIDEEGDFVSKITIKTFSLGGKKTVFTVDYDNDGDMDVYMSSAPNYAVYLFENTDGNGNFSSTQIAWNTTWVQSIHGADIDNDGDIDLLSAFGSKIVLHENLGFGSFGPHQIITSNALGINEISSADIDNDGDMDILSASTNDNKIAWYENIDGQGNFSAEKLISTSAYFTKSVYPCDIDGDGDIDILSASNGSNKLVWYENADGLGNFSVEKLISNEVTFGRLITANDMDGDGDIDVISGSYIDDNDNSKLAWYENDGLGNFGVQHVLSTLVSGISSIHISDFNNDGFLDVFSSSKYDSKVSLYKNLDGQGNFDVQKVLSIGALRPTNIYASDIDGDNDLDLISTSSLDSKLAWYNNIDGQGNFTQNVISMNARDISGLISFDLDNDNDNDIIIASNYYNNLVWYENDGSGNFDEEQIISTYINNIKDILSVDFDGDNNLDVLSISESSNRMIWYKNLGNGGGFIEKQIVTNYEFSNKITVADIDNDNDLDIIVISNGNNHTYWFENIDGLGNFNNEQMITSVRSRYIFSTDYDNDGDFDIIGIGGDIHWTENIDGLGNFSSTEILLPNIHFSSLADKVDFDSDGDWDLISFSISSGISKLRFYENVNENGNFNLVETVNLGSVRGMTTADINGDGKKDIIYGTYRAGYYHQSDIIWLENADSLNTNEGIVSNVSIYPNPTNNILTIKSNTLISQIVVYNKIGQLVLTNTNQNTIDVSSLTQDLYFIKIKDKNGNFETKKMIKK